MKNCFSDAFEMVEFHLSVFHDTLLTFESQQIKSE